MDSAQEWQPEEEEISLKGADKKAGKDLSRVESGHTYFDDEVPDNNPLQETFQERICKSAVKKNVIPKKNRLKNQIHFSHLKKHGKLIKNPFFLVSFEPSPDNIFRIGIICSKKSIALSVERNKAKRLLKEAVRLSINYFPPFHVVLIARSAILGVNGNRVKFELSKILTKLKDEKI